MVRVTVQRINYKLIFLTSYYCVLTPISTQTCAPVPYVATRNPPTALELGHSWGQPYWKLPVVHIHVAKYTLNSPSNQEGGGPQQS